MDYNPSYVLPYLAGIVDGEGCITIAKTRFDPIKYPRRTVKYQLVFKVAINDREPIDMMAEVFGGEVKIPKRKDGKVVYQYTAVANNAFNALAVLEEYLIIKKELALLGMEFYDSIGNYKGGGKITPQSELDLRETFYQRVQDLIHRHRRVK